MLIVIIIYYTEERYIVGDIVDENYYLRIGSFYSLE